jgi:hypothetical protein
VNSSDQINFLWVPVGVPDGGSLVVGASGEGVLVGSSGAIVVVGSFVVGSFDIGDFVGASGSTVFLDSTGFFGSGDLVGSSGGESSTGPSEAGGSPGPPGAGPVSDSSNAWSCAGDSSLGNDSLAADVGTLDLDFGSGDEGIEGLSTRPAFVMVFLVAWAAEVPFALPFRRRLLMSR